MLVLFVVLLFLSSIIITAINVFLVLGFLAVIKRYSSRQKDKEAKPAIEPVASV
jgi:positive regulator of sigma E activity